MENKENTKTMTLDEAQDTLEKVLMELAQNSIFNKRLLEYADSLEQYIRVLKSKDKQEDDGE